MSQFFAFLDFLGPMGPWFFAGFLGALIGLLVLPRVLHKEANPFDKLQKADKGVADSEAPVSLNRHKKANKNIQRFAQLLEETDPDKLSATRLLLIQAGYRDKDAIKTMQAAQVVLGLGLLVLGLFYVIVAGQGMSTQTMLLSALGPAFAGYYGPKYWIQKRAAKRQEEILSGFPDALDLLLVCVEAGQSLDQSIQRVSQEIYSSFPDLADELEIVSNEMKAGKDKPVVLKDLAERCDIQDISSFVTVLIQSQTFGTSIADALRVYAAEMRDKRVMRAEEKANVLPTKLTVGTMMFCVPPLLIILIGPSIHGIATSLGGGGGF